MFIPVAYNEKQKLLHRQHSTCDTLVNVNGKSFSSENVNAPTASTESHKQCKNNGIRQITHDSHMFDLDHCSFIRIIDYTLNSVDSSAHHQELSCPCTLKSHPT